MAGSALRWQHSDFSKFVRLTCMAPSQVSIGKNGVKALFLRIAHHVSLLFFPHCGNHGHTWLEVLKELLLKLRK